MDNDFYDMQRQVRERRQLNEARYVEGSKKQVLKDVEKRLKTTMIGAIATFENNFGHLWGHGNLKRSAEEEANFKLWQQCRTEILDKGNNQIRDIQEELAQFTFKREGYKTRFIVRDSGANDER